jgi:hypothetical protein
MRVFVAAFCLSWLSISSLATAAEEKAASAAELAAQKEQLAKVQKLVGSWKGVGQPQRGSTKDSWIETADWAWRFSPERTTLFTRTEKGKFFAKLELIAGETAGSYTLVATPTAGGEVVRYQGKLDADEKLILEQTSAPEGLPQRISLRFVADGKRLLVLYEGKTKFSDQLVRIAEVGMTRAGSGFGQGAQGPECVVTGGAGLIAVEHMGQKYFVCCTGCRDYFNANPEQALAEYKERKAEEKKAREEAMK